MNQIFAFVRVVGTAVEYHFGIESLVCSAALKEDLDLLLHEFCRLTGARSHTVSTVLFHPKTGAGRSFVIKAKVTIDDEDLLFSSSSAVDLSEGIERTLLGLANQLRHRLFYLQWQQQSSAERVA